MPAKPKKKPAKKTSSKKASNESKQKIEITTKVRRVWLKVRKAYVRSFAAFASSLSMLSNDEAETLYDIVKNTVYKSGYAEVLHEHPELREILKSEEDFLVMLDIYENLSWRLKKSVPPPNDLKIQSSLRKKLRHWYR